MTNRYEQRYLIDLAHRLATRFQARSVAALELSNWTEEQDLGFSWDPDLDHFKRKGVPVAIWEDLRVRIAHQVARGPRVRPDALARNISALASHMGLSQDGQQIFALAIRAARSGPVKSLCGALTDEARLPVEDAVVHLTGLSPARVRKALAHSGRLIVSGLLQYEPLPVIGLGLL
ncbi:MAG: hypothetical protein V7703_15975, partial [Hyphomicrobiales bacterium]